jgi:DNA uptake protein ComE-like DNA-binding protein
MKKYNLKLILIGLLIALFVACGSSATDEPTQEPAVIEEPTTAVATEAPTATTEPVMAEATFVPEEAVTAEVDTATEDVPPIEDTPQTPQEEGGMAVSNNKINLNNMTEADLLDTIPGFSSRMVREFFEYQPYISIQQFRREIGKYVDDAQVAAYEEFIYVPVDVDNADADTLMQLPGVDETIAAELIAARPYNSNEAFLTTLAEYLSADQTAVASTYLQ